MVCRWLSRSHTIGPSHQRVLTTRLRPTTIIIIITDDHRRPARPSGRPTGTTVVKTVTRVPRMKSPAPLPPLPPKVDGLNRDPSRPRTWATKSPTARRCPASTPNPTPPTQVCCVHLFSLNYYYIDIRGRLIQSCIPYYYIFSILGRVIEKVTQSVSNSVERTKLKSYILASTSLVVGLCRRRISFYAVGVRK